MFLPWNPLSEARSVQRWWHSGEHSCLLAARLFLQALGKELLPQQTSRAWVSFHHSKVPFLQGGLGEQEAYRGKKLEVDIWGKEGGVAILPTVHFQLVIFKDKPGFLNEGDYLVELKSRTRRAN